MADPNDELRARRNAQLAARLEIFASLWAEANDVTVVPADHADTPIANVLQALLVDQARRQVAEVREAARRLRAIQGVPDTEV